MTQTHRPVHRTVGGKNPSYLKSIGIANSDEFCNDMLPKSIISLTIFLDLYVKQELLEVIDPTDYMDDLDDATTHWRRKDKAAAEEFDYNNGQEKLFIIRK